MDIEEVVALIEELKEAYNEIVEFQNYKFPTSREAPFVSESEMAVLGAKVEYAENIEGKIPHLATLNQERLGIEEAISKAENELEKARAINDVAGIREELKAGCNILAFIDPKESYCTFVYQRDDGFDKTKLPKHKVLVQDSLKSVFTGFFYTKGLDLLIVKIDTEPHDFTSFLKVAEKLSSNIKVIEAGDKDYSVYKGPVGVADVGYDLIKDIHASIKEHIPQCLSEEDGGLVGTLKRLPATDTISSLSKDYQALGLRPPKELHNQELDLDKFYQDRCNELEAKVKTIYISFSDFLCDIGNKLYDDAMSKIEKPTDKRGIEGIVELKKQREAVSETNNVFEGILREIEKHFSAKARAFGINLDNVYKKLVKYKEDLSPKTKEYILECERKLKELEKETVDDLSKEADGIIQRLQSLKPEPNKIHPYLIEINKIITEVKEGLSKRCSMFEHEVAFSRDLYDKVNPIEGELPLLSRDTREKDCFVAAALCAEGIINEILRAPTYDRDTKYKDPKYNQSGKSRDEFYIGRLNELSTSLGKFEDCIPELRYIYDRLTITRKAVQEAVDYYKDKAREMEDRVNELIASFVKPKIGEIDSYLIKTKSADADTAKAYVHSANELLASLKKNLESLTNLPDQLEDSIKGTDRSVEALSIKLGVSLYDIVAFVCEGDDTHYNGPHYLLIYRDSIKEEVESFEGNYTRMRGSCEHLTKKLLGSALYEWGEYKESLENLTFKITHLSTKKEEVIPSLKQKFGSRLMLFENNNYRIDEEGYTGNLGYSTEIRKDVQKLIPKYLG